MKNNPLLIKILIALACLVLLGGALCAAFYFGILHLNYPELSGYTTKGVDVSSYQGDIDWNVLSSQGIEFAYIKATEGSSTVDRCFDANWNAASKTEAQENKNSAGKADSNDDIPNKADEINVF